MDPQVIYQKYLESAVRFLSFRPRSEKEVRDNLLKKKAPPEVIEKVVTWLKEQRFINDEEFTVWWIEQRSKFRPKALSIIKLELKQKGIKSEVIDTVVQGTRYKVQGDLESARKVVEKKIGKYSALEKREIYQKLGSHLARKGFSYDVIKKVFNDKLDF